MRMHPWHFKPAILAGIVLCALSSTPTLAVTIRGAKVIRFQGQLEFLVLDGADGLMVLHGLDQSFAQLCSGAPFTVEDADIQMLDSPAGALLFLFKGEHSVWVYPSPPLPDPGQVGPADCPILAGLPLLASGKVQWVRTDNDITLEGPGADAFGWTAHGSLTGPSSQPMWYSESVRLEVPPSNSELGELRVDIRLVPVGPH